MNCQKCKIILSEYEGKMNEEKRNSIKAKITAPDKRYTLRHITGRSVSGWQRRIPLALGAVCPYFIYPPPQAGHCLQRTHKADGKSKRRRRLGTVRRGRALRPRPQSARRATAFLWNQRPWPGVPPPEGGGFPAGGGAGMPGRSGQCPRRQNRPECAGTVPNKWRESARHPVCRR